MSGELERQELTPEDAAFEKLLAALRPAPSRLDRDRLMFRAGQLSVEGADRARSRRAWLWPIATAALVLLSATLGILLTLRPGPRVVERIVEVPRAGVLGVERGESPGDPSEPGAQATGLRHEHGMPGRDLSETTLGRTSNVKEAMRRLELSQRLRSNPTGYLPLRDFVLAYGVAALPDPQLRLATRSSRPSTETPLELRNRLLRDVGGLRRQGTLYSGGQS